MKIRNERKKILRLLVFLVSGLLVMTAGAAVYNYMYMEGSPISVEVPYVKFEAGADVSSNIGVNGTYAQLTNMAGWPNVTRVYQDAVRINNTDTSGHTCNLIFDSWSGSTGTVNYIYVKIFDTVGGTQQAGTLSVTASNSTGTFSLPASTTYYVQWEIRWNGGAQSTDVVNIVLKLSVT